MKVALLSIFLLISTHSYAVIYGENSLKEVSELTNGTLKNQAKAVAGVFRYYKSPENSLSRLGKGRNLTHKTVCEEEEFSHQPIESVATAFLISPKVLLTVGHAVGSEQDCKEKTFFSFDYLWQGSEVKELYLEDLYFCKRIIKSQYVGIDYALIELDREAQGITPLELDLDHQTFLGEEIYTIGHPLQLPKKYADGHMRSIPEENSNYYTAELDSFRGNSGSPIFSKTTQKVIGILKDGEMDFELDEEKWCYMFKKCPEDGITCRGESITRLDKIPAFSLSFSLSF